MMNKILTIILLFLFASTLYAADMRNHGSLSGGGDYSAQNLVIYFMLVDPDSNDGDYVQSDPSFASGDCRLIKDNGSWAQCSNTAQWEGEGMATVTLTSTELSAAIIVVKLRDLTSPQAWKSTATQIVTGGASGALFYVSP